MKENETENNKMDSKKGDGTATDNSVTIRVCLMRIINSSGTNFTHANLMHQSGDHVDSIILDKLEAHDPGSHHASVQYKTGDNTPKDYWTLSLVTADGGVFSTKKRRRWNIGIDDEAGTIDCIINYKSKTLYELEIKLPVTGSVKVDIPKKK